MSSACLPLPASLPPLPASACLPQLMEGWMASACLPLPACLPTCCDNNSPDAFSVSTMTYNAGVTLALARTCACACVCLRDPFEILRDPSRSFEALSRSFEILRDPFRPFRDLCVMRTEAIAPYGGRLIGRRSGPNVRA